MSTSMVGRRRRLPRVLLALAAVLVVALAALLVLRVRGAGNQAQGPSTPAPTAGASSSASPVSSATPSPSPSTTASPDPSATSASSASARPSSSARPSASPPPAPRPTASATRSSDPAPTATVSTKPPVPIDKPDEVERGLTARVSKLESVTGEATGPGEIAGPALRAAITLSNDSGEALDLSSTVVNLYYGSAETPASALSGPAAAELPRRVKAGGKATGRFVFSVPAEERSDVLITVDYSVETPVVAFRGRAPR